MTCDIIEIIDARVDRFNIGKLCVNAEQIPGHGTGHPITDRFAHGDRTKAIGKIIANRCSDTYRRRGHQWQGSCRCRRIADSPTAAHH
jgi:hypothetical protein